MTDIVICEFMDEAVVARAFAGRDVLYDPKLVDDTPALTARLSDARALIVRNRTQVRGALLSAAPRLRVVGRLGVGLDNIDLEACRARGIDVHPASGANDASVAEYVIGAALVLLRRTWFATPQVIAGQWPRMNCIGREMSGRTLGLIGYGAIARETAIRARALGMSIAAHDPFVAENDAAWQSVRRCDIDTLLRTSDVLSLHVPLTPQTRHMIDASRIATMRSGAILINAARGGVLDEAAVAAALRTGHLGGAALDVFETEPLTAGAAALFDGVPNLLLTPHIAGVTDESNVRVSEVTAAAVLRTLDG
jgi:(S)-sulfolactate dehydrogenase